MSTSKAGVIRRGLVLVAAGAVGFVSIASWAADDKKPKHEMKEIMTTGHKGKTALLAKVVDGSATDQDKKALLEMYDSLKLHAAPKGDAESWKTKTSALYSAMEAVIKGDKGAVAALQAASNCKACHSVHKP